MTARIGDMIVIPSHKLSQPAREGEIREIHDGPGGVIYLVRWSDTGYESMLRPVPDMVIKNAPDSETIMVSDTPRLHWLLHPLAWRHRRDRERAQQARDEQLAWRVEHIIAGLGLTHTAFTVAAGRTVHVPEVVAVNAGPPVGVDIRMLPGQTPGDFAAHASAIAYNLDVDQIRIVPLGPSRIRLDLLRHDTRFGVPDRQTVTVSHQTDVVRSNNGSAS